MQSTPATTARIGIGPIGWANDDLRGWGPPMSGERIVREIAESGYDGSEMSYLYPQDPAALRALLEGNGIVLASAYRWTNLSTARHHQAEMEAARRHVDFCANAGASHVLFAEGGGSLHWDADGPRDRIHPLDDAAWTRLHQAFDQIGTYARSRLMTACLHPHGGTAIEQPTEIARFLEGTDAEVVSLCLDTGHTAYAGADPAAVARDFAPRIRYVHLKDVRREVAERVRRERPTFFEAVRWNVFATPGAGSLDFPAILDALRAARVGWYVVEADQDPAEHHPLTVARDARSFLHGVLGR